MLSDTLYWDDPKDVERAVQYANRVAQAVKDLYENDWELFFQKNHAIAKSILDDYQKNELYEKQMEELDKETEKFKQRRMQEQKAESKKRAGSNKVKWVIIGLLAVCAIGSLAIGQWFFSICEIGWCIWIFKSIEKEN